MPLTPWLSHYKTDFELARRRRNESIQFDGLRCEAFDRFLLLGFPTTADDGWRFTDITALAETNFSLGAKPASGSRCREVTSLPLRDLAEIELVFVNGYFMPDVSTAVGLPNGAMVSPLAPLVESNADELGGCFSTVARVERLPFVALNTALFEDGAAVIVPARTTIEAPVHLRFISNGEADAKPAMSQPRVLVVVGEESRATLIESYTGPDGIGYFTNAVTEVVLGEGAALDHYKLQRESTAAYHIAATHVIAARRSNYRAHAIACGSTLVRNETLALLGEGAACALNGMFVAGSHQLVDTCTLIDHAAPGCISRQRHKGILGGGARGVFNGRNLVRVEAHGTSARQLTRALLLSPHARMDVKPDLEMLTNHATCTQHVGVEQLDDKHPSTRRLMAPAFARNALDRVRIPRLRSTVEAIVEQHVERALATS